MMKKVFILLIITTSQLIGEDFKYELYTNVSASPIISIFQEPRYPGVNDNIDYGYGFIVECNWKPSKLLSLGLSTGYMFFAEDKSIEDQEVTAKLEGIPIQLLVCMGTERFRVGFGMGVCLLNSKICLGRESYGFRSELGISGIASYYFDITDNMKVGPEMRVFFLSFRKIISFMPSVNFKMSLLEY